MSEMKLIKMGVYVPSETKDYIIKVQKELSKESGYRSSQGQAITEIIKRLEKLENEKNA